MGLSSPVQLKRQRCDFPPRAHLSLVFIPAPSFRLQTKMQKKNRARDATWRAKERPVAVLNLNIPF